MRRVLTLASTTVIFQELFSVASIPTPTQTQTRVSAHPAERAGLEQKAPHRPRRDETLLVVTAPGPPLAAAGILLQLMPG